MREAFSNCPEDEYEIIRTSSYLFYVDADFKLVTFISNIDVENLETFHKVEKKIYEFARSFDDLGFVREYVELPEEFHGSLLRFSLRWLNNNP